MIAKRWSLNHVFFSGLQIFLNYFFVSSVTCVKVAINTQNLYGELKVFVQHYAPWM